MIVGVAGPYGAGKGEVVRFLAERSFYAQSLSDVIRRELAGRALDETRERMIALGNELRSAEGQDVLAQRVIKALESDRNYVIDSIRHPAEVRAFQQASEKFLLLWVDAPADVRISRIRARARPGDPGSQEDLERLEGQELHSDDPSRQQLSAVRDLADHVLWNDQDLATLHEAVSALLKKSLFFERPGWDEYFMSIARVVASRSNCVKRKVAAVITLEKRIISTGYNGTPRGVRNCNEGGCRRCNSYVPGGTNLSECVCSHGEENAIVQAAFHGVTVRGGTIYTTLCPCLLCTKMIINAGLAEVVYNADYPMGDVSLSLLREGGVKVRQI